MSRPSRRAMAVAGCLGLAVLAGLAVLGCGDSACGLLRTADEDVRDVLAQAGMRNAAPRCRMVNRTRDVTCTLPATEPDIAVLAAAFGLTALPPGPRDGLRGLVAWHCPALPGSVKAWGIAGRPASLRLPSGAAFEFLVLHYDQDRQVIGICTSYAYG